MAAKKIDSNAVNTLAAERGLTPIGHQEKNGKIAFEFTQFDVWNIEGGKATPFVGCLILKHGDDATVIESRLKKLCLIFDKHSLKKER